MGCHLGLRKRYQGEGDGEVSCGLSHAVTASPREEI